MWCKVPGTLVLLVPGIPGQLACRLDKGTRKWDASVVVCHINAHIVLSRPARWHVSQPPQVRATEVKAFKGTFRFACVSLSSFGKGNGARDPYGLVPLDDILAV